MSFAMSRNRTMTRTVAGPFLHAFEQLALVALLGHLYAHELFGGEYLLELCKVLFLQCGAFNLYIGECVNHHHTILFGTLMGRNGTRLLPHAAVCFMLLALQFEVEGEESGTLFLSELGMLGDKLLLLGLKLLGSHAWAFGTVILFLGCCGKACKAHK